MLNRCISNSKVKPAILRASGSV